MKVALTNLQPNPYRDMDKYPIDERKVAALVESVRQTDFWDNLLARPAGNVLNVNGEELTGPALAEYLKTIDTADFTVELAYGHHRWVAVDRVGFEEIDIPVKVIEDEIMLQIMANENKGDWASNMSVILETVRQVRNTLHSQAAKFDKFEDYLDRYSFFTTQKEWNAAQKVENIGYRTIHKFLGETWSENDIKAASATLGAIDDGVFEQEQVIRMPTISAMRAFQALAKTIRDNTMFPDYFKQKYINEAAEIISDTDKSPTIAVIDKTTKMVRKNNLPIDYLTKQKITPFDLVKELKKIVTAEESTLKADDLLSVDGLAGYEGLDEAVAKVKEAIKRDEERRARAGGAEPEGEGEGGDDEAQAAIDKAEGEAQAEADAGLPPLEEVEVEDDVSSNAQVFAQSARVFIAQTERLHGHIDEIDEKLEPHVGAALENCFRSLCVLGLQMYGKEDLMTWLNESVDEA